MVLGINNFFDARNKNAKVADFQDLDHLDGVLFIDYLSKLKKNFIVKKLSKQKKALERIVV